MSPEEIRLWSAQRALAAARERAEEPRLSAPDAWAVALDLCAFSESILGWPLPEDPVGARKVDEARAAWARLRARLPPRTEP